MLNITYREIDKEIEEKIVSNFGKWVKEYDCLHYGDGVILLQQCLMVSRLDLFQHTHALPEPLNHYFDAYIDVIEVDENYRRRVLLRS